MVRERKEGGKEGMMEKGASESKLGKERTGKQRGE